METMDISKFVDTLQDWKKAQYFNKWKVKTTAEKIKALEILVYALYYQQEDVKLLQPIYVLTSTRYGLHVESNTVLLDQSKASILSTLHEIGHAVKGVKEVDACAFSVKLFAKVFPTEYANLVWKGHMLKLPK